ncbi:DNA helicase rad5 [Dispira simplex]|nr:DNA helicase rad5 [Dispira simplex]
MPSTKFTSLFSLLGDQVPRWGLEKLHDLANGNTERAVELFFQETEAFTNRTNAPTQSNFAKQINSSTTTNTSLVSEKDESLNSHANKSPYIYTSPQKDSAQQPGATTGPEIVKCTPNQFRAQTGPKYSVGEYIAMAYLTSSTHRDLSEGLPVRIERNYSAPVLQRNKRSTNSTRNSLSKGGKRVHPYPSSNPHPPNSTGNARVLNWEAYTRRAKNTIVRIQRKDGTEIGRLRQDSASFMAPMLDLDLAQFEAVILYAPTNGRFNLGDELVLQVTAYLTPRAFAASTQPGVLSDLSSMLVSIDSNKNVVASQGLPDDERATLEERQQHDGHRALCTLFAHCGLKPNTASDCLDPPPPAIIIDDDEDETKSSPSMLTPSNAPFERPTQSLASENVVRSDVHHLYAQIETDVSVLSLPEHPQPLGLCYTLHGYQRQALSWMIDRETISTPTQSGQSTALENNATGAEWIDSSWHRYSFPNHPSASGTPLETLEDKSPRYFYMHRHTGQLSLELPRVETQHCGGILADEMGLGKTIEILSLIHAAWSEEVDKPIGPRPLPCTRASLIVCPMSLLSQWKEEALQSCGPQGIRVDVYYGDSRDLTCLEGVGKDKPHLLITSYGTLLADYLKSVSGHQGQSTSSLYAYQFHRIVLDEAHSIKSRQSKTFRACCTLQARRRWAVTGTPIVNCVDDLFSLLHFVRLEPWCRTLVWKNTISDPIQRSQGQEEFSQRCHTDVDLRRALDTLRKVIQQVMLRRTKTLKLPSGRFIVSLPPIQVRTEYVAFTQGELALYEALLADSRRRFNSLCDRGVLWHSYAHVFQLLTRLRLCCCHPQLLVANLQRAHKQSSSISEPVGTDNPTGGMANVTPVEGKPDTTLATPTLELAAECPICLEAQQFHPLEQAVDRTADESLMMNRSVDGSSLEMHQHQRVFPVFLPCQHMVCSTCWLEYYGQCEKSGNRVDPIHEKDCYLVSELVTTKNEDGPCTIVLKPLAWWHKNQGSTGNKHTYDTVPLLQRQIQATVVSTAALFGPRLSPQLLAQLDLTTSTKVEALLTLIQSPSNRQQKVVVFSQFTSFLELISVQLTQHDIAHVQLHGKMTRGQRELAIQTFRQDPGYRVILLSLRAGGTGLNLTCASRVFLMDPWWNTAIENQAIDRVHRLGQTHSVEVVRFVVQNSVEERMLQIQLSKRQLIGTALGQHNPGANSVDNGVPGDAKRQQKLDELKLLFR